MNLDDAKTGISIEKTRTNLGLRPTPWIEKHCDEQKAQKIKIDLLEYGISSTVNNNGIRIQGINNCKLAIRHVNPDDWWVKCVNMMVKGKHLKPEGLIEIVKLRNQNNDSNAKPKWNVLRVIREINRS